MGRKAVLTAEERKTHRQESARKWYQAHKAKNPAGAKTGKSRKAVKTAKKTAKHAVNKKATPKKVAKELKAFAAKKGAAKIKAKIEKLREKRDTIVAQIKTLKEELKALKAAE